jgi:hypothetical protein
MQASAFVNRALCFFALAHVLTGKPVSTFPEHALARQAGARLHKRHAVNASSVGRVGMLRCERLASRHVCSRTQA